MIDPIIAYRLGQIRHQEIITAAQADAAGVTESRFAALWERIRASIRAAATRQPQPAMAVPDCPSAAGS